MIDRSAIADTTIVGMDDELRRLHVASGLAAIPYTSGQWPLSEDGGGRRSAHVSQPTSGLRIAGKPSAFERVMALARVVDHRYGHCARLSAGAALHDGSHRRLPVAAAVGGQRLRATCC